MTKGCIEILNIFSVQGMYQSNSVDFVTRSVWRRIGPWNRQTSRPHYPFTLHELNSRDMDDARANEEGTSESSRLILLGKHTSSEMA